MNRPIHVARAAARAGRQPISVVIPTLNCVTTLPACVGAVGRNLDARDEIVIADAGSGDGTVRVARELEQAIGGIRLVRGGGLGGLALAIQEGVSTATHDVVLVLDVRVGVPDGFVSYASDVLADHPEASALVVLAPGASPCVLGAREILAAVAAHTPEALLDADAVRLGRELASTGRSLLLVPLPDSASVPVDQRAKDAGAPVQFSQGVVRAAVPKPDEATRSVAEGGSEAISARIGLASQADVRGALTPSVLLVVHDYVPHNYGGVEVYTHHLARELASRGCGVAVLYPVLDPAAAACTISAGRFEDVMVYRLVTPPGGMVGSLAHPEKEALFRSFLQEHAFDVVHFQHTNIHLPMSLLRVAKDAGFKVALTLHDFWFLCPRTHLYTIENHQVCTGPESVEKCRRCLAAGQWSTLNHEQREQLGRFVVARQQHASEAIACADVVSAPSRFVAAFFAQYGQNLGRIEVLPLGTRGVKAVPKKPSRPLTFGYVGTIHPLKNVFALVEEFAATRGESRLLMWGGGEAANIDRLTRAATDARIQYRGPYTPAQLSEIFAEVDVAVVPSLIESYCFTAREALTAGVPVLAANVGGIPDAVVHAVNGLLFDPRVPGELRRNLQAIVDDPGLLQRLQGPSSIQTVPQDAAMWQSRYMAMRVEPGLPKERGRRRTRPIQFARHEPPTIAVFSIDNPDYACSRLRLGGPLGALGDDVKVLWGVVSENGSARVDTSILRAADLVVVQRIFPRQGTRPFIESILASGKPVIYETDDLLVDLPHTNPHKNLADACAPFILDLIGKASAVTVSTDEMKAAFAGKNDRIFVLPNLLDEDLWGPSPRPRAPDARPVVIGYAGTPDHLADLQLVEPALLEIAKKYGDRVSFRFVGCATDPISALPNFSFVRFDPGYASYARALPGAGIDVGVVPLCDNSFNRCKSNIKWLEYSACRIPGVYSDLPPYNSCIRNGETGLLVKNTNDAWFRALDRLVGDSRERHRMSWNADREVRSRHTLAAGAHRHLAVYREVLAACSTSAGRIA